MKSQPERGRPRDPAVDRRIGEAVLELLRDEGFDGVTFEAVARRAGASKATLYRRWPSKREMVLAAVKEGPASHAKDPFAPGDSLRADLLALARRLTRTMAATDTGSALMLLQAGLHDPDLCEAIEAAVGPTGARLPQSVIDAAIARGELPPGSKPFAYEEVVGAVLLLRHANNLPTGDGYLEALVDGVIIPSLVNSPHHTDQPGIFSGHHSDPPTPQEDES